MLKISLIHIILNIQFKKIATELFITEKQVSTTADLLEGGATIPFISRYRKELTGSLDEIQVMAIRDRLFQLNELEKRRQVILASLTSLGKLTDVLKTVVNAAETLIQLEDIYLPYRPKRTTRASIARERGLEPLSVIFMEQQEGSIYALAECYVNTEKGILTATEAISGARDILAEIMAEDPGLRAGIRDLFLNKGKFSCRVIDGQQEKGAKYSDYFEWSEPVKHAPIHRVLAMRRAEKEQIVWLEIRPEAEDAISLMESYFLKSETETGTQVKMAIADSYKRLLGPSMETEVRLLTRKKADQAAIKVFTENIRQLLLAPAMGEKRVLAIDPGFRTGCKVVCLDEQGKLLDNATIFPHTGAGGLAEAEKLLKALIMAHQINVVAIGNGTAGRETEMFVRNIVVESLVVVMVSENGASVYSASEVAREEFGEYDITVRGAVSIGRRLIDPLAELVKIDPKSMGVGQYQHDVDQKLLQVSLDDTVISCVNQVGVELNTASKQLLSYVSGLNAALGQQIVEYRNKNGAFTRREDLKKVPRLGDKAFEQAAGFLRIRNAENPLDSSAVHPERYDLVHQMANDLNTDISTLISNDSLRKEIKLRSYVSEAVGLPTLQDIVLELAKPGRDPREVFEVFNFTDGLNSIADLKVGMQLPGIITNITNFGAFVDIGVHQDGLVHMSQLSNRFIKDPNEVVKVQQKVLVTVTDVDIARKRIALSMKTPEKQQEKQVAKPLERIASERKPAKQSESTNMPRKKMVSKVRKPEIETDLASKLAALKDKFK